jgi:hypothetical protein
MPRRCSGHRGGRGGRGGRKPEVQKQETKKKKSIENYYFYVGSSKQASDFKTTSKFHINYVNKTFERGNVVAKKRYGYLNQPTQIFGSMR